MKRGYDFSRGERGKFYCRDAKLNLPSPALKPDWAGVEGEIVDFIVRETEKTVDAYERQPHLVTEHANHEHDTARGGYAHRQLFELVQNSADALVNSGDGQSILVRLTGDHLYCADDGRTIDAAGVAALMFSHMSSKRNTSEIGRFGLGFKSVLGVTHTPEFYSRSGSFRFDGDRAAERIAKVASADRYPILRLPVPVDVHEAARNDEDLYELTTWATNIVRLPLDPGARDDLAEQMREFPAEFLLFVDHVRYLTFESDDLSRDLVLDKRGGELVLSTGERRSRWKCFKTTHELSAPAQADRRSLDDSGDVPIWWAAPLDGLNESGYFWHFFPTKTASLLAGILNAPWKTNEDRQNLLPGPYNDELIDAAASLVATHLPELATEHDPALHLDALPRRHEAGDTEQSERLRARVDEELREQPVAPDQTGRLCQVQHLSYAPEALTARRLDEASLERWASFDRRPTEWLHHSALTRDRIAKIDRLFPQLSWRSGAPRASMAKWLEALVDGACRDDAVAASQAALQVAAAIPEEKRSRETLGNVLLTQSGDWCEPDPDTVFLPASFNGAQSDGTQLVHAKLVADEDTAKALSTLGIKPISPESRFRVVTRALLTPHTDDPDDSSWNEFWSAARAVGTEKAHSIIVEVERERRNRWNWMSSPVAPIRARTRSGRWGALSSVLLPGAILPSDGNHDSGVRIDTDVHAADVALLRRLGATDSPREGQELKDDPLYQSFRSECRTRFISRDLPRNPHEYRLVFDCTTGSGPLEVLKLLSDEGRAGYTDSLLSLETTYDEWTMRHETQGIYPPLACESPAIAALRQYGRIRCAGGIIPIRDALGPHPANPAALSALLSHRMAHRIKEVFDLSEPVVETLGEEDPVPLTDVWPGLAPRLSGQARTCHLIRCQQLGAAGASGRACVRVDSSIYLAGTGDEHRDLHLVSRELGLDLEDHELQAILRYVTPQQVLAERAAIRQLPTNAERLLHAVGDNALRAGLPDSLVAVLESRSTPLTGTKLAEAAIATYHTSALKQYRWALERLAPPERWAGSARAVEFVQSLGFSAEWAGQRGARRTPYLEVDGPFSLPPLHAYQRLIVAKVRDMLCNGLSVNGERRGMISLPTGSGKTRVAVQAIVEAICHGFAGGVLWVADRDELCEQAVEAWRQVWSGVGAEGKRLRISRMWAGQPRPLPASELHVIVATIQTLNAKLSRQPDAYAFLSDFKLVVFDEAHRSVAPTYTSVMQEIGLTRWQRDEEPFLIGLTATPYRRHDETETARLVRRYGSNRFDAGAFATTDSVGVVHELQKMEVIARADHMTIEGGDFLLNPDELSQLEEMPHPAWLPRSMEDRIAADAVRTERIVDAYRASIAPDWPTLIFATSVEHAQTVAGLLNASDVTARAVSGSTETTVRRDVVEMFRAERINVLVNYGVFREGFDAPRTRAIIVARPVYSPNLYFQMIGRGLRGLKNGGNDRCLIVNVRDNIENFNRQLAFSDLDWLWGNP